MRGCPFICATHFFDTSSMSSSFRRPPVQRQPQEPTSSLQTDSDNANHVATSSTSSLNSHHGIPYRRRGTKPWTNGITLTSMGVRDIDAILGGGQPLGTCVLIEEDRWNLDFASSLVKYWCAEAISQEQFLWTPILDHLDRNGGTPPLSDDFCEVPHDARWSPSGKASDVEELLQHLPRNLHWDKQQLQKDAHDQQQPSATLDPLLEGDNDDGSEEEEDEQETMGDDEGLEIAWQYRKSIQQQRLGHPPSLSPAASRSIPSSSSKRDVFCHSYDLSGRMTDQKPWNELVNFYKVEQVSCCGTSDSTCSQYRVCGYRLFVRLQHFLKERIEQHPNQVVRILLFRIESCCDMLSVALPLLLYTIRQNDWPVVILMTAQPWKMAAQHPTTSLLSMRRTCDVVLQLEAFAARREYPPPPEFRHFQGVMVLQKLAPTSVISGHFAQTMLQPPAMVYGLKRDRRKLHTSLLHIPPEDYAQGGGSVGRSGVRSGAGLGSSNSLTTSTASSTTCGSHSKSSSSSIDF